MDLSVGAERTTVLKAVSEGETRFRSMAMACDTDLGFPSPDGPGRQFLAEFGEFPVYLVNRDMQVCQNAAVSKIRSGGGEERMFAFFVHSIVLEEGLGGQPQGTNYVVEDEEPTIRSNQSTVV